ncbi:ANTAR domain-containing protein [Arthrobacter echini]|uniref:ANTAR domain-containing protein n=2 Tax=Arthrobacter echini TaxID=1529066 RepID=A0A4V3Z667_9MICC|nr:ANTAR domain-containing protein [Arthrobacter echini]
MAGTLSLPLKAVEGQLHHALEVLGIERLQDLTSTAVTSHLTDTRSHGRTPQASSVDEAPVPDVTEVPDPPGADDRVSVLVLLDRAEAAADQAGPRRAAVADRDELTATRALLEQQCRTILQLQQSVASRDIIGQAKGILMERHKISADTAFVLLQNQSSRRNRKLVEVAAELIHTGEEQGDATHA